MTWPVAKCDLRNKDVTIYQISGPKNYHTSSSHIKESKPLSKDRAETGGDSPTCLSSRWPYGPNLRWEQLCRGAPGWDMRDCSVGWSSTLSWISAWPELATELDAQWLAPVWRLPLLCACMWEVYHNSLFDGACGRGGLGGNWNSQCRLWWYDVGPFRCL